MPSPILPHNTHCPSKLSEDLETAQFSLPPLVPRHYFWRPEVRSTQPATTIVTLATLEPADWTTQAIAATTNTSTDHLGARGLFHNCYCYHLCHTHCPGVHEPIHPVHQCCYQHPRKLPRGPRISPLGHTNTSAIICLPEVQGQAHATHHSHHLDTRTGPPGITISRKTSPQPPLTTGP